MRRFLLVVLCAACLPFVGPRRAHVFAAPADQPAPPSARPAQAWFKSIQHTPQQPRSAQPVRISLKTLPAITSVTLEYQIVDPGAYIELKDSAYARKWLALPMKPETPTTRPTTRPASGPAGESRTTFSAILPPELQTHRRLVRYRFKAAVAPGAAGAAEAAGQKLQAPDAEDATPNYAYFVYDGVPAWSGAVNPRSNDPEQSRRQLFPAQTMRRVQTYQFIGKRMSVENVTWNEQASGKEYKYTGTLVVNEVVYDHVRFRARGGVWRYAIGKNMWKFDLPADHRLAGVDDFGHPYPVAWSKLNLRPCIQLGSHGMRGEQGMYESVGFRLFNLAGVAAPFTHWVELRIIDDARENPANQYDGDFWGLYLAIEDEDGHFLKSHHLPDGNLYKLMNGAGGLSHQGKDQPTTGTDVAWFINNYSGPELPEKWSRTNLNLPAYYSYRSIVEAIHHYDIGGGKNYDYYFNPIAKHWQVIPWDIDLTWDDQMYGDGEDPFKHRLLDRPEFRVEYQNRFREIRDLLFNAEQTGLVIDECMSVIYDSTAPPGAPQLVEADRRKWDFHPALAGGSQGGQGAFYRAAATHDFPGMVQRMRDYIKIRADFIDNELANDPRIPATPTITYTGPAGHPANRLRFRASPYKGAGDFAAIQWRIAEVAPRMKTPIAAPMPRGPYEITALWQSDELKDPAAEQSIPDGVGIESSHTYRVRGRVKDTTGRWSRWSGPVEFIAGGA